MEENFSIDEKTKLQLEANRLKCRFLEIKKRLLELINQEKKKKSKESTPPPLKERKEKRKEALYNNYNNKKRDSENLKTRNSAAPVFIPATQQNIVAFNAYKPVDSTGAISLVEYERMKKEGKV